MLDRDPLAPSAHDAAAGAGVGATVGVGAAEAAGAASMPSTTAPPTARAIGVSGLACRLARPDTAVLRRARLAIP